MSRGKIIPGTEISLKHTVILNDKMSNGLNCRHGLSRSLMADSITLSSEYSFLTFHCLQNKI